MPLHPEIKRFLDSLPSPTPGHTPTPEEIRKGLEMTILPIEQRPVVQKIEDRVISGSECNIPIRIYTPFGKGPFPLFVYFHGGGWISGNLETHDVNCRELVNVSGYKVVAVDYRLAPEYPFPAAPNDCYEATKWVAEHVEELEGDINRLVVGGPSAGGNLAAAVTLMARDRQEFSISKQVLIYPSTDLSGTGEIYPSIEKYGRGYGLTIANPNPYIKEEKDAENPYCSPIKAKNLSGLPPALIITAEYDPLRDEAEAYADRLKESGVDVICKRFNGTIHGFMFHFRHHDDYKEGFKLVRDFLNK